jgi:Ser/Thr protein kinase RdoA (MazF antagonist)
MVRQAQRELGASPDVFGLIHSDLHQENYLFHRGRVRAIDFDDCGWGHFVYDLAVTLSELQHLPTPRPSGPGCFADTAPSGRCPQSTSDTSRCSPGFAC